MATEDFMDRSLQHAFEPEEVMAYLDGELEPRRAAALAGHLEHCTECQNVAKSIRQISTQMLGFEIEPAPQNLTTVVFENLKSSPPENPAKPVGFRPSLLARWREFFTVRRNWAAAAGLAMVFAVVYLAGNKTARAPQSLEAPAPSSADLPASRGHVPQFASAYAVPDQKRQEFVMRQAQNSTGLAFQLQAPAVQPAARRSAQGSAPASVVGPMIEQNASLSIVAKNYDEASAAIEKLAKARGGYTEKLDGHSQSGSSRSLSASLRVPANQLDAFLADLRQLGHVEADSLANEEVSAEYVDLQARLHVAQATERSLVALLATRTGRLEDVLDVERELARVRSEIESMQGQSALMLHQVSYATVQVELSEEYHQKLHSDSSVGAKLRNAFVGGLQNLQDAILGVLIFFLNYGLAILFWLAVILIPAWLLRRVFLRRRAARASQLFQRP
jgi:anti-sigma factor RsiW